MSWLFSRALVAAYSEATCSDGARSALSSGSPTPQAFLPPDRMTAFSRPSRFGMTFKPLTDDLGAAVLTWCQEASRARTSASPAREQASTEPAAECGVTWRASLARFDPATSSWRTAQPSLLEDWGESSVTWPRSGMTAGGQCWELPTLEHRISGTGSGLRPDGVKTFHTPNTNGLDGGSNSRKALAKRAEWPTPRAGNPGSRPNGKGGKVLAEEVEIAAGLRQRGERMWPTPTASAMPCEGTQRIMRKKWLAGELSLEEASAIAGRDVRKAQGKVPEMWPTPRASENDQGRKADGMMDGESSWKAQGRGATLTTAVLRWTTPTAHNAKETNAPSENDRNTPTLAAQVGGQLNPTWVEWLMGWPLGWTDLKPLETAKSPSAPQQHSNY